MDSLMKIKIDYFDHFLKLKDKRIRENVQDLSLRCTGKNDQYIEIRIKCSQRLDIFVSNSIEIIEDNVDSILDSQDNNEISLKLWITNYKSLLHIIGPSNLRSKFNDIKNFITSSYDKYVNNKHETELYHQSITPTKSPLLKCSKRGFGIHSDLLNRSGLTPDLKINKVTSKTFSELLLTSKSLIRSPTKNTSNHIYSSSGKKSTLKHSFFKINSNQSNISQEYNINQLDDKQYVWTDIQQKVINACIQGKNIFFTGGAGTGKTTLLTYLIQLFIQKYSKSSVYIAATTGLAACAIGGTTIYQFVGITTIIEDFDNMKLMKLQHDRIVKDACRNPQVGKRCREAKVLLIDEISMLNSVLLEILNTITQLSRGNKLPMGGIQVVFTGDFYQLPPVVNINAFQKNNTSTTSSQINDNNNNNSNIVNNHSLRFCFQSPLWSILINESFELQQVYRQQHTTDTTDDQNNKLSLQFISVLNKIRIGQYDDICKHILDKCVGRRLSCEDGILPTQIFTHKKDVDQLNNQKLAELSGKIQVYHAVDSGKEIYINMLKKHCRAKTKIVLKIGAQVILVKTTIALEGLVNGARGTVVEFDSENLPKVMFTDGIERTIKYENFPIVLGGIIVAERQQLPLDLCWGISVHKSQGMTVDKAIINVKHSFEYGQVYVALSRVRSIEGLSLLHTLQSNNIKTHPDVIKFYKENFKKIIINE